MVSLGLSTVADLLPFVAGELAAGRSVIVDNTLPGAADRAPFVELGRAAGVRVVSVRLESTKVDALARNAGRMGAARVPDVAVHAVAKRLEDVTAGEGFDELFVARCAVGGGFEVGEARAGSSASSLVLSPEVANVPRGVVAAIVSTADPEKARAVRRLVAGMGGTWDGEAVESLAAAWGCALADVQALVIEASIEAGRCALPPELAREEALATLRSVRDKAATAADFKSQIVAAGEILKIQLAAAEGDGETMTKAQFVALARRLLEAVGPYPGAREAAIAVLSGG